MIIKIGSGINQLISSIGVLRQPVYNMYPSSHHLDSLPFTFGNNSFYVPSFISISPLGMST